jgi:molybdopterin biosynthesis enzyme
MLRVKLVNEPGGPFAVPLSNQGSGVLTSMSRADAVVVVNPGEKIASGEERRGYLMGEIKRSACFEF